MKELVWKGSRLSRGEVARGHSGREVRVVRDSYNPEPKLVTSAPCVSGVLLLFSHWDTDGAMLKRC